VIKTVLFDLDGTLLDSAPDLVGTLNYLRSGLGLGAMPVEELRHFVSQGAVALIRAGMPPCDEETLEGWRKQFLSHYADNSFVQSRPFDGVEYVLSDLTSRRIPWGIVTNKMESLSLPILDKLGWLTSAETIICGDTVSHCKPHPAPVLAACEAIGIRPRDALMVGDDRRDIQAGQRAGSRTALALYGYATMECRSVMDKSTDLLDVPMDVLRLLENDKSS
jgi:phosphoglycolate phosphatase